jgi:ParB-like chromosome segregation protein Spo0J
MKAVFEMEGRDIALTQLKPVHTRNLDLNKNPGFRKILATIKAVGLIEPVAVYPSNDEGIYLILDGYLRYKACQQLGVASVPCIIYQESQAYSFNKNVNRLTAPQEIRMLRKSLETIDEVKIAKTFGLKSFEQDVLTRACALELAAAVPERQTEILAEMKSIGNYSPSFCRSLILQTPMAQRINKRRLRRPWTEDEQRKQDMISRLQNVEKEHDFYSSLYRKYSADLLRIAFYVRKLVTNPKIEAYLKSHHQEVLERFTVIITDTTT